MNIHEFQAKQIFSEYGLPVPKGDVAKSVDEAVALAANSESNGWVVKAQVHAGGRGKAGGVKLVKNKVQYAPHRYEDLLWDWEQNEFE